tara:strand:- start:39 stop:1343 length:1305 start_codon:yes stop_codon:yes gene_type:complete
MKLAIIGTGYVGLVTGLCFAEFGFDTVCVDKNLNRLEGLKKFKSPFSEPGLDDLLLKHLKVTKQFSLSENIGESVKNADVVFITVGTPSKRLEKDADLTSVYQVAKEISENISTYKVIVTKSTVPVGTTRKIKEIISKKILIEKFDVVSNPEFLREGSAINDFMRPDRIVIGIENKKAEEVMKEVYRPLYFQGIPIISTSIETSEIIKYASNSFLATKIAFINEVADLCEVTGADIQDVTKAMGIDKRIGSKFLNAGPGYGGSCFPKDVKAFSLTAKKNDIRLSIIDAVDSSNESRPKKIAMKIKKRFKNDIKELSLGILGLSFKPNTDDIRDSTSLIIADELLKSGAKIKCFDPKAMNNAKNQLPNMDYCLSAYQVCEEIDCLIIATEWNEFRALNFHKVKKLMKKPIIFDLRNIYNKIELTEMGIEYYGVGK